MTANLTAEQVQALSHEPEGFLRLVDPQSNKAHVLVPADEFERIQRLLEEDFDVRDAYAAQLRSAFRAGWDDPTMDDYDNYHEGS
jgi:hypothetical protein